MKFTKVTLNEVSACAIPANQGAVATITKQKKDDKKRRYKKQAALTTAVSGHSHIIYRFQDDEGSTDYVYSSDDYYGHSHPWVRDAAGNVTIGEAEGHSHEVATIGKSEETVVKGPFTDLQKANDALAEQDTELTKARAANKAQQDEIAELKKTVDSYRNGSDDDVVYVAKNGRRFFKHEDPDLVKMAKERDQLLIEKENAEIDRLTGEMPYLPGDGDMRRDFVKTAYAQGEDAVAELRKLNDAMAGSFKVHGIDKDYTAPAGSFDELVEKLMAGDKTLTKEAAITKALNTPEGMELDRRENQQAA